MTFGHLLGSFQSADLNWACSSLEELLALRYCRSDVSVESEAEFWLQSRLEMLEGVASVRAEFNLEGKEKEGAKNWNG